jgi:hypothetical protein
MVSGRSPEDLGQRWGQGGGDQLGVEVAGGAALGLLDRVDRVGGGSDLEGVGVLGGSTELVVEFEDESVEHVAKEAAGSGTAQLQEGSRPFGVSFGEGGKEVTRGAGRLGAGATEE